MFWLSPVLYKIDYLQVMFSFGHSTSTDLPKCGTLFSKKSPAKTSQITFDAFDHSQYLWNLQKRFCKLHKSFCAWSEFLPFLTCQKWNVAYFLVSSMFESINKNMTILKKMHTDLTAVIIQSKVIFWWC